jgi:hypothetical protein
MVASAASFFGGANIARLRQWGSHPANSYSIEVGERKYNGKIVGYAFKNRRSIGSTALLSLDLPSSIDDCDYSWLIP